MTDAAAAPGAPGAPGGAGDLAEPVTPGEADPFFPAWRVVAVAGALVVVAFGIGWAALVHGGGDGAAVPGGDAAAGSTHDTAGGATTDRHPPSQPASPVSFAPDGTVVRPPPVLARVIDPASGAVVLVPLPPGKTVDVHTGRIVPVDPTTTEPGWTTTTSNHGGGGTTTTVADPTTTTGDTTSTTEVATTTTEGTTTTVPDTSIPDTTVTVP